MPERSALRGSGMLGEIVERVESLRERLIGFRRDLHRHPELSGREERTARVVAEALAGAGVEVKTGIGGHGLVGLLCGGDGPTIALRADMDALPIQDRKEVEYASSVPGVMHACGHDVHTTVVTGAALVLSGLRRALPGNVKFIFQPSEESGDSGAERMIAEGVLEAPAPSAIVALHCHPELEVGKVGHRPGVMTASSDRLGIVIKGRSGHASRPHQAVDAILVSSLVINAIHHLVSRRVDPLHHAVISLGTIRGGTAPNIIADRVEIEGTVRAVDPAVRKMMPGIVEETIRGITAGMGAGYDLDYTFGTPPLVNDPGMDELVRRCSEDLLGPDGTVELPEPLMGSEDFACFAERVPGVLFRLGTGNRRRGLLCGLHNSYFDVDEESIIVGTKLLAWIAARYLEDRG